MFPISIFNSVKDKTPKNNNSDYLIELINNPKVCNVKEANSLFAPAKFNGTRSIKNALEVYALVLDYDSKELTNLNFNEEIKALESLGLTFWAYTTHSHTEEKNCFRVILPLKEPIPNIEYTKLWNWAYKITQEKIDKACKDISRISYLPCHKENAPYKTYFFEGSLLDWENLPSIEQKADKQEKAFNNGNKTKSSVNDTKTNNKPNGVKADNNHTKTDTWDNKVWNYICKLPESISGSHGHDALERCAYVLVQGFGLSEIEAYLYFERWNKEKAKPPESEYQLRHKLLSALSAPLEGKQRGWLKLESKKKSTELKEHKLDDSDFAKEVTNTYSQFRYDSTNKCWREWVNTHWKALDDSEDIRSLIEETIRDLSPNTFISSKKIDSVLRLAQTRAKQNFKQDKKLINFLNGTLNLSQDKFYGYHNHSDCLCSCFPYSYDPDGDIRPNNIIKFLLETFKDEKEIRCFMVHLGLALMKDTSMHKALIIIGLPASGKTTAIRLANLVCGLDIEHSDSFAPALIFDRGSEGNKARATWNNNNLICIDELPVEAFRNEETLKCMVAHSGVGMRQMYKIENTDNKWLPKLIFTTNDTPTIKDFSGAIQRRLLLLETPNQKIGAMNLNLLDSLIPELGSFAHYCLKVAKEALKVGDYPVSVAMGARLKDVTALSNPLIQFVDEYLEIDKGKSIEPAKVYDAYKLYCKKEGISINFNSSNWLTRKLKDMGYVELDRTNKQRLIKGITLSSKAELDLNDHYLNEKQKFSKQYIQE